jgi:hypothetical protein
MRKLLLISTLVLLTACSEKVYKPEMKLKLIDKTTNNPITEALNSQKINVKEDGTMTISKKTITQIIAPFDGAGPRFISTIIGIAPKGYKPQWCLCYTLNYKEECLARIVRFTPQKNAKEMSIEDLEAWIKKEDKNISIFYKVSREQDIQKQTLSFCSEDSTKFTTRN